MSETQARWFGQICRGRVQLPQKHLMEMDMEMEMVRNLPELAQHCCGDGLVYAYLLCAPLSVCVCERCDNSAIYKAVLFCFQVAQKDRWYSSARHTIQRDPIVYNDEIASFFGAKPDIIKHPAIAWR